jgi:hypothetical protein
MKATDFCYWLQGYFELKKANRGAPVDLSISQQQAETIMNHLALVFKHDIDPKQGTPEHQAELQSIHDGRPQIGDAGASGEIYRC